MTSSGEQTNVQSRRLVIVNERGLHARAAAKFVATAGTFTSEITVTKDDTSVSGRSIMGLMMLAAGPGSSIEVSAAGSDATAALAALETLVGNRFDE
jgi:phosphocarrier protein HPr